MEFFKEHSDPEELRAQAEMENERGGVSLEEQKERIREVESLILDAVLISVCSCQSLCRIKCQKLI